MVCPLAFGKVGVKERVKSVLNYKKSAFWLIFASIVVCLVVAVCFLTTSSADNLDEKMEETSEAAADETTEETEDETSEETPEWVKEEINVERYDVTHDGIDDYIITALEYDPAFAEEDLTQKERIVQQLRAGFIRVNIYEGKENSEEINRERALWSHEYSDAHAGNGQLSIVHIEDKDWLLTSSLYTGQGYVALEYEIFSLNQNGEMDVFDKQTAEFEIAQENLTDKYKEFQTSLNQYTEEGVLIIACDIDLGEQFVRTRETPCVPRNYYDIAFTKFDMETEDAAVEAPMAENRVPDISSVASIIVINGDTGEEMIFNRTDSNPVFDDLLELYDKLDFVADAEENTRIGYRYCMKLQDAEGNTIQIVTPYKDGFSIDGTFYQYNGGDTLDFSAVKLMNYMDLLFYPAARAEENRNRKGK